ncbi:hypothetical protein TNCV_62721 [Trichonephila clavipes]|nr:hypothetical protein TNCV_62721 [Trichonephila clavipes]
MKALRQSLPNNLFPVRLLVMSQWSNSFKWKSLHWKPRRLCSKGRQHLTSLDPVDSEAAGAVPTPISGAKYHHVNGTSINGKIVVQATPKPKGFCIICPFSGHEVFYL